ncbi:uncharacterized protein P174DRAFT_376460 [Aspergillus novofumigatus IBT 16806]|uniref:Uncharacterized protein n=1 Tax=Aspergillus novofumigatus (strain IBT 16806) TaxID=1392255 RepID=A0A2I1BZV5_ASPN1|nr:uncharacterized protein P174DRAFT_376460 [Aspergillus novofumigatus IBT 16806]PKX90894.1 hypothetical protein P174DRAFT_376460 [Aspergillus novofumigatus IBT 16806]
MIQTKLRFLASCRHRRTPVDGIITSVRFFTLSHQQADNHSSQQNPRIAATQSVSQVSSSSSAASGRVSNSNVNVTSRRNHPRRVVDARSLAVPKAGSLPSNIIRSVRFQKSRTGAQTHGRRSRTIHRTQTAVPKGRKQGNGRTQRKRTDVEEVDEVSQAEVEEAYVQLSKASVPVPVRYTPQPPESNLTETWPSLPTGVTARAAGVVEKLSWLSDRFPNGYVPPHELGKRLFEGRSVQFFNQDEKDNAVSEAQKLARKRADTLSQRKGDLVEPEDVGFKQMSALDKRALVEKLVQGNYPKLETVLADKPTVLTGVVKNLNNNETYRTAGKSSQFISKVESLLASGRPASAKGV